MGDYTALRLRRQGADPVGSLDAIEGQLAALRAAVWRADAVSLDFTDVSHSIEQLAGYPRRHWLAPGFWSSVVVGPAGTASLATCRAMVERGQDHEMEYQIRCRNGELRWVQDTVHVLRDADGCAVELQGLMLDITERKMAEIAAESDRGRLDMALEASGAALWDRHLASNRLEWHTPAADILGYPPASLATLEAFDALVIPQDRAAVNAERAGQLRERHQGGVIRFRVRHADGSIRTVESRGRYLWRDGAPYRVVGLLLDVSEHAALEAELRLHSKLLEAIPVGVTLASEDGTLRLVNGAIEKMYGWPREQLIGRHVSVFTGHSTDENARQMQRRQDIVKRDGSWTGEVREQRQDRSRLRVRRTLTRVADEQGPLWISTRSDVTEIRALEAEVLEASETERVRLAERLHEGLGQKLAGVSLLASSLARDAEKSGSALAPAATLLATILNEAVGECRQLAQSTTRFVLSTGGLETALRALMVGCEREHPVRCLLDFDPAIQDLLHRDQAKALLQFVDDGLAALVERGAPRRIIIELRAEDRQICIELRDDGGAPLSESAMRRLKYRLGVLDGTLETSASPPSERVIEGIFPVD
jgi:PAS domain S-box-containing protein